MKISKDLESALSVMDLMEQTGFFRSLVFLYYHGPRTPSSMREIAGSYDSAVKSFSNMERLGLGEKTEIESMPYKQVFTLTESGKDFAKRFVDLLETLEFKEREK